MTEIITAKYENGVLVPEDKLNLAERQTVYLQILPPMVQIAADTARRRVTRLLLDEVSYLMGAGQPQLIETETFIWRVPILLTYPDRGTVGEAGYIDVDAGTGELLISPGTIEDLKHNARELAASATS